jgi:hypothetical protein
MSALMVSSDYKNILLYLLLRMLLTMQKICKCKLHLLCRGRIQRKPWCMRPMPELTILYLTLCPLQSRFQHIYYGQPYAKVDC